jgi:2-dehydro-3-deoxygalactonokinase
MSASASASAPRFLSCDWGTSSFRLRLVEVTTRRVIAESRGDQGVAATFAAWQAAGAQPAERWGHFARVIALHLARIADETGAALAGLPLVISGMASSSMGMRELPYRALPLAIDGSGLSAEHVAAREDFPHALVLVAGVRSHDDVMRGEETQLIGAGALAVVDHAASALPRVFVFPGTHSKHIEVRGAHAVAFRTYMTGEFFALLSRQSVLANSVAAGAHLSGPENLASFDHGVRAGAADNLLHAAFRVRTRALLENSAPTENYHYLSGLLIGAELRELAAQDAAITLVGADPLRAAYQRAFYVLGARSPLTVLDADDCLVAGQLMIATRLGLL